MNRNGFRRVARYLIRIWNDSAQSCSTNSNQYESFEVLHSGLKLACEFDAPGWHATGSLLQIKFDIFDNRDSIAMKISQQLYLLNMEKITDFVFSQLLFLVIAFILFVIFK